MELTSNRHVIVLSIPLIEFQILPYSKHILTLQYQIIYA